MNPKTSTSADKELREAVARQLDYDCAVPSQNIGVAAANGVVTLSGFVATYADKQAAEQAARCARRPGGGHPLRPRPLRCKSSHLLPIVFS